MPAGTESFLRLLCLFNHHDKKKILSFNKLNSVAKRSIIFRCIIQGLHENTVLISSTSVFLLFRSRIYSVSGTSPYDKAERLRKKKAKNVKHHRYRSKWSRFVQEVKAPDY